MSAQVRFDEPLFLAHFDPDSGTFIRTPTLTQLSEWIMQFRGYADLLGDQSRLATLMSSLVLTAFAEYLADHLATVAAIPVVIFFHRAVVSRVVRRLFPMRLYVDRSFLRTNDFAMMTQSERCTFEAGLDNALLETQGPAERNRLIANMLYACVGLFSMVDSKIVVGGLASIEFSWPWVFAE